MNISNFSKRYFKARTLLIWVAILTCILLTGCKKMLDPGPPTQTLVSSNVFTIDQTAIAVLTDLYGRMVSQPNGFTGSTGISIIGGIASDELTLHGGVTNARLVQHFRNDLNQQQVNTTSTGIVSAGHEFWAPIYNMIYQCNDAIIALNEKSSQTLTPGVRKQLLGEAYFLRAFYYFYMSNLYGEVPLVLSTDPKVNALQARSNLDVLNKQIVADLQLAQEHLSDNFLAGTLLSITAERVRPTKWAATTLLARIYLYNKEYAKAEEEATKVINQASLFDLVPLNSVFLKNSKEAIWQLQPTKANFNTDDGVAFIIPATGPSNTSAGDPVNPVYISKQLLSTFEPGDKRAAYTNWIDTTIYQVTSTVKDTVSYPYKYKVAAAAGVANPSAIAEYLMIFRLAELFLIRGEARTFTGNIAGAQADLNKVRNRSGLANTTASSQLALEIAFLRERQVELFSEMGHRWFDLKRTGKINDVMGIITPLKGGTWQSTDHLFPFPYTDLFRNPQLTQNPGY